MKKRLLVVGGHGSGEIAMSVFEEMNNVTDEWILEGFLTDIVPAGERLGRHNVLGGTEETADWVAKGYHVHYALHLNAKAKRDRVAKFESMHIPLEANATAVHPRAYLDPSTNVGYGVLVCAQAATSFGARIGNFVHCYTNSFVGHDTTIEDCSTVTAHCVVGARVRAGKGCHIGLNSCIREDIQIGEYAIIGMGSVVTKDVRPSTIVVGNPGKYLKDVS
jgi:sugar O-acyltransferase (sialic acid O-acetyltransferase NeuD family)